VRCKLAKDVLIDPSAPSRVSETWRSTTGGEKLSGLHLLSECRGARRSSNWTASASTEEYEL